MFTSEIYSKRRAELRRRVGSGLILLPGNVESPFNYPNNTYNFRQDSTFLYFFGHNVPLLAGVIDADSGEESLYGDDFTVDDIIWMGPQPTIRDFAEQVGVASAKPMAKLAEDVKQAIALGRKVHYLPPYRGETKLMLSDLLGIAPAMLHAHKSLDLLFAVAEMREKKSAEELAALEEAFEIGYQMHTAAMRNTAVGRTEHEVAAIVDGMALRYGTGVSFTTILSQHGEVLHNHDHSGVMADGRLLLCDAGGEHKNGYVSDHTRTFPVNGKFTQKQKDIYNIVLRAHDAAAEALRPNMMYTEYSDVAFRTIIEGLKELDLVRGSVDDALAAGAGFLFMPHGLGHGIGLDVHDCENIGERSFSFGEIAERAKASACCITRQWWRLMPGTVLSDEPGIYFVPDLIDKYRAEGKCKGIVNYDKLEEYRDFGGIRLEDDLIVTEAGSKVVGDKQIPIKVEDVEAIVGQM
ncbi:MAG: aminopeptidase P N-terminal domain-containing protein [Alistipes sp.]|nr:M24 family metallopeptidase [Rikenellaceae bacterium]MBQ3148899.1 aminopeptidase P N-terminal domain-containing protein [Alistipes sp.]MBQ4127523.1 aminopeptidase P N-terminal domain-containing protein [Alistipes sp.]